MNHGEDDDADVDDADDSDDRGDGAQETVGDHGDD